MQVTSAEVEVFIPVAKLYHDMMLRRDLKNLFLYLCFFITYVYLSYHQFDAPWAHDTKKVYDLAMENQGGVPASENSWCNDDIRRTEGDTNAECWWDYPHLTTLEDFTFFISNRLSGLAPAVIEICSECLVGVSMSGKNIGRLQFEDMACTDFTEEPAYSNNYVPRNCAEVNADWEAKPDSGDSPCCKEAGLMEASLLLMAWETIMPGVANKYVQNNPGAWEQILKSDGNMKEDALDDCELWDEVQNYTQLDMDRIFGCYLKKTINNDGHFMQLMILREGRMMGMNFDAELRRGGWDAEFVNPTVRLWSYRYDTNSEQTLFTILWIVFLAIYCLHAVIRLCLAYKAWGKKEAIPRVAPKGRRLRIVFFTFVLAIPLVVLAMEVENSVKMPNLVLLKTLSELGCLAMLMVHFEALDEVRMIIRIITNSSHQLLVLLAVLVPLWLIMGILYCQLFGIQKYSGIAQSWHDMFTVFANGQEVDPEDYVYGPTAFWLMYYVSALVLVLTLSQVFITILMAAYDQSREDEAELQKRWAIPEGYQSAGRHVPWYENLIDFASEVVFTYSIRYNDWDDRVLFAFEYTMEAAQRKAPKGSEGKKMFTMAEVRSGMEHVGGHPTMFVTRVRRFGYEPSMEDSESDVDQQDEELGKGFLGSVAEHSTNLTALPTYGDGANAVQLMEMRSALFARAAEVGTRIPWSDLEGLSMKSLQSLGAVLSTLPVVAPAVKQLADLRAAVFTAARQAGHEIQYAELEGLSKASLEIMMRGLQNGWSPDAGHNGSASSSLQEGSHKVPPSAASTGAPVVGYSSQNGNGAPQGSTNNAATDLN